jgi:hypothetical protein
MIGLIRFTFRGGIAEAVLSNDGYWSCAAVPCLVRPLDILYSPNWEGLSAGRRHLEAAARWLEGTVVFGAGRPIPRTARALVRRVRGDLFVRRSHQPAVPSTERSDRVSERTAAKMCGVGLGMIRLWVETGAWPMPRRGGAAARRPRRSGARRWKAGSREASGRPGPLSAHEPNTAKSRGHHP